MNSVSMTNISSISGFKVASVKCYQILAGDSMLRRYAVKSVSLNHIHPLN